MKTMIDCRDFLEMSQPGREKEGKLFSQQGDCLAKMPMPWLQHGEPLFYKARANVYSLAKQYGIFALVLDSPVHVHVK
jgi:hypothetical protein